MRHVVAVLAALAAAVSLAESADAASVVYVDGGEVWAVDQAGGAPQRLTAGEGGWNSVDQSAAGHLAAVRNDPGKISSFSTRQAWDPDGRVVVPFSSLPAKPGWSTYAYPLGLDVSADGGLLAYGFSNSRCCQPPPGGYEFDSGTYVTQARQANSGEPLRLGGSRYPAYGPTRMLAVSGDLEIVQQQAPNSDAFAPWLKLNLPGETINGLASGGPGSTITGVLLRNYAAGSSDVVTSRALAIKSATFGGDYVDDCFVPTTGQVAAIDVAPDGTLAWVDEGGLKVAGAPAFEGPVQCTLTSPARVIGPASAKDVAIGPFAPAVPPPPPGPSGGGPPPGGTDPGATPAPPAPGTGGSAPAPAPMAPGAGAAGSDPSARVLTVRAPARVAVAALRRGVTVTFRAPAAGTVRATLAVGRTVLATGSVRARRAGEVKVRLRATPAQAKRAKRLRARQATLTGVLGTQRVRKTVRLR